MRKIQILFITIFLTISAFGQNFDSLMTVKKQLNCLDVSYNSSLYFVEYISENKIDLAKSLVSYWESKCELREEPVYRAKILLALKTGEFNDSIFSQMSLRHILDYQHRMNWIEKYSDYSRYDSYRSFYPYTPKDFDNYTRKLALELKNNYPEESLEYVLAEFYSDNCNVIFSKIRSITYKGSSLTYEESPLITQYNMEVEKYKNMSEYHIAGIAGVWIPTGALKKIGIHPELGLQGGVKHKKMNYDFTMILKFINSPNNYYARRDHSDDSWELTNYFLGGYIGFDIGRDIYAKNGHEIQLAGGIAFDGFTVFKEDKDKGLKSVSANSYNFNFGLAYRYYITNSVYIGLRTKYNVVDYSLNKTIDFTGNPVTVQFTIGSVYDLYFRNERLKALNCQLRK